MNTLTIVDTDILIDAGRSVEANREISDTAVGLLRQYRLSHGLAIPDALIAATAIALNQRDYRFINGLELLSYPRQSVS